jgi:flavin-dependent thymidylate synthase
VRREELREARRILDETVTELLAQLNGEMMSEEYKGEAQFWTEDADGDPVLPASNCPTCGSPSPTLHPAVQHEGEVQPCADPWHGPLHPQAKQPGTVVQKWADQAMFTAEPIDAQAGPQVHLLWMTADPLAAIAAASKMYKGEVARSLRDVTHAERQDYVRQIMATKLQAPFEFVKFHFFIEGVTRAFTHQMVRQRTAVYAQESLRFAVKEDMPVGLPPSLAGTEGGRVSWEEEDLASDAERQREHWDNAVKVIGREYKKLVDMGMPAEDARGLLPHNTLTRLHYCTDLRALLDHAGNRLCTQAQFEWRLVFAKIAQAIREYNPYEALVHSARHNMGDEQAALFLEMYQSQDRWQYETIADLFRPVCYLTGKCEFKANFDRACSIRDRVDAYAAAGTPSSAWDKGVKPPWGEGIKPIFPAEWLLNPGAAR